MLFETQKDTFESEKERNLYYKFFAGYFFNELVTGFESRLATFCELLSTPEWLGRAAGDDQPVLMSPESTHVSFDNHSYLFANLGSDRGEFADILVHDRSAEILVSIEAKLHSDWSYKKDVKANEERLKLLERALVAAGGHPRMVQCLLLTKAKWEDCQAKGARQYSNYRQMEGADNCRIRILLWEKFEKETAEERVRGFLASQLERPKRSRYTFSDGWFVGSPDDGKKE